ncbi:hypothetical protein [Shewanella algidipiscicola]|nr:hypothetical protein [Shewanella algidipiscicola]
MSRPWRLDDGIPAINVRSRIYTGLLTLFDVASLGKVSDVLANI